MKAAILKSSQPVSATPLVIEEVPRPQLVPGRLLLRVLACGVCRTDLHIAEHDLPPLRPQLIPGHQIVGEVVAGESKESPVGSRVGVSWMGGVDGDCWYCRHKMENLCDRPIFTGYTVDGGYAEYALARADFTYPLPAGLDDIHVAPLLCAGIIGFRCLRLSGIKPGAKLAFYGFGAAAHVAIQVARHWGAEVYAATRGAKHQQLALSLGAVWAGEATDAPPAKLDASIIFAPAGELVPPALAALKKGGVLVLGGIHMSPIPSFDYNLLYQERVIRSVANNTRKDGEDFLRVAAEIPIHSQTTLYPLREANRALNDLKSDRVNGAAVLDCRP